MLGKSLEIKEKVLGRNHSITAVTQHNLGMALLDAGQLPRALKSFQRALKMIKAVCLSFKSISYFHARAVSGSTPLRLQVTPLRHSDISAVHSSIGAT